MPTLRAYSYQALDSDHGETRLIILHAGVSTDPIRVSIIHIFVSKNSEAQTKVPTAGLEAVQETLPAGWSVSKTVEDRLIFHKDLSYSSWTHPNLKSEQDVDKEEREPPKSSEKCPNFEALSYCWGLPEPHETLIVVPAADASDNPCLRPSTNSTQAAKRVPSTKETFSLKIGPNLASALRHLRLRDRPRRLWVDAICIDQENVDERGKQVAMMGNIYRQATIVTVWLGDQTESTLRAFEQLEMMGRQIEVGDTIVPSPDAHHPEWLQSCPLDKDMLEALQTFFALPWFSRVWIWQEIILGSPNAQVYCGHKMVPWYFLRRCLVLLRETKSLGTHHEGPVGSLLPYHLQVLPYWGPTSGHNVGAAVGLTMSIANSVCTDARDRLYGILGLAHPDFAKRIIPNYCLSTAQVYTSMVNAYIAGGKLTPLEICDLAYRKLERAPSWVPDLSNLVLRPTYFRFASGNTKCEAKILDEQTLRVLGVISDVVTGVSSTEIDGTPPTRWDAYQTIDNWYQFATQNCHPASLVESFFTGIFFGWVKERRGDNLGRSVKLYAEDLLALRAAAQGDLGGFNAMLVQSDLIRHFMQDPRHCSFLCTDQGNIGLGPIGVRQGISNPS